MSKIKKISLIVSAVFLVLVIGITIFSTTKKVYPISFGFHDPLNSSAEGVLQGYDPVSYFVSKSSVKGSDSYSYEWNGTKWYFSSRENLDLFTAEPEKYAPQFGGYCAFAVSKGFTADVDPNAWHIENGKLYLFADSGVRQDWLNEISNGVIEVCEDNWN